MPENTKQPDAIDIALDPLSSHRRAEKVADILIELAEQKFELELFIKANNEKLENPALIKLNDGRLTAIPDDKGEYDEDGTKFKSYKQRLKEIDKGRNQILKDSSDIRPLINDILVARRGQ